MRQIICDICEDTGKVEIDPLSPHEEVTMDFCICQIEGGGESDETSE